MEVTQKYNLFRHIRFSSRVEEARWRETENKWEVAVQSLNEKEAERHKQYTVTADFLISAVGQLNNPKYPDFPGMQDFKGKTMHSARWDWTYDLKDKKVAIIGSGSLPVSDFYLRLLLIDSIRMHRCTNCT